MHEEYGDNGAHVVVGEGVGGGQAHGGDVEAALADVEESVDRHAAGEQTFGGDVGGDELGEIVALARGPSVRVTRARPPTMPSTVPEVATGRGPGRGAPGAPGRAPGTGVRAAGVTVAAALMRRASETSCEPTRAPSSAV
ncbi:hypothetical protein GCM10025883_06430 [Mobilicoccus caccae]|uniref:Uncharacterized protein n=1 Tax=Mobilicoccus caccae TaxID=1859295 RepID=A0ABQ6IPJ2_9MICO|nr:hypothetical protein GCM10025883_06430 [Mobilicoccus caccae]